MSAYIILGRGVQEDAGRAVFVERNFEQSRARS